MTQEALDSVAERAGLAPAALDSSGEPVLSSGEAVAARFAQVALLIGSDDLGPGTLFTTGSYAPRRSGPPFAAHAVPLTARRSQARHLGVSIAGRGVGRLPADQHARGLTRHHALR